MSVAALCSPIGIGWICRCVTPASRKGRDPLGDVTLRSAQIRQLQELIGDRRLGLLLLAIEIEVLDDRRLLLEAVAHHQLVIEVLALGAHAADVERNTGTRELAQPRDVLAFTDREQSASRDHELTTRGIALGATGGERRTPDVIRPLGDEEDREPAVGDARGHLDVLLPQRCDPYRDVAAHRVRQDLERLTQPGALVTRQRQREVLPLVHQGRFASPDVATDVDDLASAPKGIA